MADLSLRKVKKVYDNSVVAVQDFNLEIADKEFIVLVGPSGCGKSTTLRMVAGLEAITDGEIYIGGRLVNNVPPKDRDIAMVFQNYALYPHMTVYDNIAYGLKLRKLPKRVIDQKVREAAEILDISELLARKPSEIIKLRKRINTTFIYVTHDQTEAMTLGDRIVIMKEGYIQQVGTPQEVFIHPANLFVAGFIGTPQMNFFDAELVREGDRYHVSLAGATVTLSPEKCRRLADGGVESGPVTLGVRPEHMVLTTADNAIFASVDVSEMMGSAIHIHVDACGRDVVIVVPVSEEELETRERALAMGTPVRFTFRGSAAHLFDRETGVNLEWKAAPEPPAPPEPETPVQDPPPLGDPFAESEEVPVS